MNMNNWRTIFRGITALSVLTGVFLALLAGLAVGGVFLFADEKKQFDQKIAVLQRQVAALGEVVKQRTGSSASTALSLSEVDRRQKLVSAQKTDTLEEVVAQTAPSVVSIVISKDVPQLEVTYEDPFGDDPFFQNLGIRVPVYRQKGTVRQKVGAGSGFIVTADGYIVTNRHVASDPSATYTVLLADGSQEEGQVVYRSPDTDVAVLKISG
ncbi:S1C family serine protease, partial [Candidatus Parcubacteria bacterium]|nr:S1C family serine protease [Candidatus Parcubacteria bacterium]